MLGFKSIKSAHTTIIGYEILKKGQHHRFLIVDKFYRPLKANSFVKFNCFFDAPKSLRKQSFLWTLFLL